MMGSGLKLWGVVTASALVLPDDAPTLVKAAASLAKVVFGDRIQICDAVNATEDINTILTSYKDVHFYSGTFPIMKASGEDYGVLVTSDRRLTFSGGAIFKSAEAGVYIIQVGTSGTEAWHWNIGALEIDGNSKQAAIGILIKNATTGTIGADGMAEIHHCKNWGIDARYNHTAFVNAHVYSCGHEDISPWTGGVKVGSYWEEDNGAFNSFHFNGLIEWCGDAATPSTSTGLLIVWGYHCSFRGVIEGNKHYGIVLDSYDIAAPCGPVNINLENLGMEDNNDADQANVYDIYIKATAADRIPKAISIKNLYTFSPNATNSIYVGQYAQSVVLENINADKVADIQCPRWEITVIGKETIDTLGISAEPVGIRARMLKRATGMWSMPGWYVSGDDTLTITANMLYFVPIYVAEERTYVRIAINTTVGAVGTARLGIYEWDIATGLPGALLLDAGTVDTAAVELDEIVIDQLLPNGFYFLAIVCDAAPTLTVPADTCSPPVQGYNTTFGIPYSVVLTVDGVGAQVAGGLADPATTPTAEVDPVWGACVRLRD